VIVVIGAGPAGLLAAWHATRAGHEVTVVEAGPAVGGLAGSFEVAGQRVDHGSHRLHPSTDPALLAELQALLGDDLQVRPRNGRIVLAGRTLAFPLRTGDLLRNLPRPIAARMALDAATAPLRRPRRDTYAEVVRAGLGPTVERTFYGPYARKLWGVDGDELAGEVARRRISASSPTAIARKLVRATDPSKRTFLYPRRGFGQISEALADAATAAGATIRLGAAVTGIAPGRVTLADGGSIDAASVWSTMPIPALPGVVGDAPVEVVAAAGRLEHRAMVLLYLVLDQPAWTDFDAHYLPDPHVVASRLSEPKRYRTSDDDPSDRTVLCAEIPCAMGDEVWTASPTDLAARLADELTATGLPPIAPVHAEVRRVPRLYPVYRPGYEADLATVEAWVDAQPGLVTFGRQGLFVADNTHHVLAMGAALARTAGGPTWPAARDRFRQFVVED
jgi:protoporphyrinogen oxidase